MFQRYLNWQSLFVLVAIIIAILSIIYANDLTTKLAGEEQHKVEAVAKALEVAGKNALSPELDLAVQIISSNTTIPLIITNQDNEVLDYNNQPEINETDDATKKQKILTSKINEYAQFEKKIDVKINDSTSQYVYYGESALIQKLRVFPFVILGIFFLFIILLLYFLNYSNRYIQDKVWVGMSKETAHQLGTPLTSMIAWLEHLKEKYKDEEIIGEMGKDVDRLQLIADRFSKIGSQPNLEFQPLIPIVESTISYMQLRAPKKIRIELKTSLTNDIQLELNKPLFEWVLENLIRNALDSLEGKGEITFKMSEKDTQVILDVSDTGKGIPKSSWKRIFNPGFSTKKRGWGLGLSLSKRIMKEYHHGDIFVKQSELGKGTTFRIILNKI